jgi:hypothetical protein
MAVTYFTGRMLVDFREFASRVASGEIQELVTAADKSAKIRFTAGAASLADLEAPQNPQGEPFQPIGIGKPLSIRIHTIYVGDLPGRRRDILIASGVKAAQTFDATSRMVNLLQKGVRDREFAEFSPFTKGSPIVYYTGSLTDNDIRCGFEVVPDTFPEETVNKVAGLFNMAGGLPIFAPAASVLLAGSFLTKIFARLGNAFLEKGPVLAETLPLQFGVGGVPSFKEGIYAIFNDSQAADLRDFRPGLRGRDLLMVNDAGDQYAGDAPYMILGIDGKEEPALDNLSQQIASAAILEKFYPSEDGAGVLINELGEATRLYNDLSFKQKAEELRRRLDRMSPDDSGYAELKALFDAYRQNIQQEELKVPELAGGDGDGEG